MKRTVEDWSIERLELEREKISFPEYQREKRLWPEEKKSLLIDSILRDIDIPKLYFNRTSDGNYEVVDGQQRLWAIWDFLDDQYPYSSAGTKRKFSDLEAEQGQIKNYRLQITVLEDADDDYLRLLFLRLQLGLLLITGEKLHVAVGEMKEFVFAKLAKHPFIENLGISAKRFAKETLCAQICINSFAKEKQGAFTRTRHEDLQVFFELYERPQGVDRDLFEQRSKYILMVLDRLWAAFGARTQSLKNRSYILSIYLFAEELVDSDRLPQENTDFVNFVLTLWERLRQESSAGFDRKNRELYSFETYLSSAPGEKYQIQHRQEKLRAYYDHFKATAKIPGDEEDTP